MATMNVDYKRITITGTIRESRRIRTTLALFAPDVTIVAFDYHVRTGTVVATVTINTTNPIATVDEIGDYLSRDTIVAPSVSFTD